MTQNKKNGKSAIVAKSETVNVNNIQIELPVYMQLNERLQRVGKAIERLTALHVALNEAYIQHTTHIDAVEAYNTLWNDSFDYLAKAQQAVAAMESMNLNMSLNEALDRVTSTLPDRPLPVKSQVVKKRLLAAGNDNKVKVISDSTANMELIYKTLVDFQGIAFGSLPVEVQNTFTLTDKVKYGKINGFYQSLTGKVNSNTFDAMKQYNIPITHDNLKKLVKDGIAVSDGVISTTISSKTMMEHALKAFEQKA